MSDEIARADCNRTLDDDMRLNRRSLTDNGVWADDRAGADLDISSNLRVWIDNCGRVNLSYGHFLIFEIRISSLP